MRCIYFVALCMAMAVCLKTPRNFSFPLKTSRRHVLLLYCSYVLDVYIFITYFLMLSLMSGTIPALNLTYECIIFLSSYLDILFTLILSQDKILLSQIELPVLILLIVLLQKQEYHQKNTDISITTY